mmetsp:Transcript_8577/g.16865  ORF Transcript_8577/g.16865 Transcript_8577/m.16865 type:complete len:231 (+) Transcript_8577:645-1337(+)
MVHDDEIFMGDYSVSNQQVFGRVSTADMFHFEEHIVRWTSGAEDCGVFLTHFNHSHPGCLRTCEMKIGEFRYRMSQLSVNRSGQFPSLKVHCEDLQQSGSRCHSESVKTVTVHNHNLWLSEGQKLGDLQDGQRHRVGHVVGIIPRRHGGHFGGTLGEVLLHKAETVPAFNQKMTANHQWYKLKQRRLLKGKHKAPQLGIVRSGGGNNTHLDGLLHGGIVRAQSGQVEADL